MVGRDAVNRTVDRPPATGPSSRRALSVMDTAHMTEYEGLPGWELVSAGLADLHAGRQTVPAMLVASASIRLRRLGIGLPPRSVDDPQDRLYELLAEEVGEAAAHSRYNALRRRLLSFLRSAESNAPTG
jgi:hypothetical protein